MRRLLVFLFVIALSASARAQVVFDAASSVTSATASNTNPVNVSWNHTVGTAKKPYLVVSVSLKLNGGGATVGSVTYGSEAGGPTSAMTLLGSATNGTTTRAELWGLSNPTAGTHQITVSVTNGGGQNIVVVAGAKSFTNVFQSTPAGTVANATGNSTTPTVAVANGAFDAVVDAVAFNGNNALTAGASQTNTYNFTNTAPAFSGAGSTKTGTAATSMSWTAGVAATWAIVAVPLQPASPQILFDAVASTSFANNTTTFTGSWNHTTTNAANRYLVVGVSIDEGGGATTVTGVRYGTEGGGPNVAMTSLGVRSNGTNDRVELWGLVAPASGTHQITVTMGNNTGTRNTTVIAGSQTFSGVEQTAPTGTFASNTGNTVTPTVTVTNGAYDYVVDVFAFNTNAALTPGAQQDSRYAIVTTAAAPVTNFSGGGSGTRGYANTTTSWTAAAAQQWAIAAIPLKPATVQLKKVASADVIKLGQTVTYTLTATNYGSTSATNVTITDAIPAGATFVSQTGCAGTGPVTCNIGTLASGATSGAITITVVPTSAGPISNVASVTFNGSAVANVSETRTTLVEAKICATPGKDGNGGTLAGIVNDYWPGTNTVSAGATSVTIGARRAGGLGQTIAIGDLVIVMQMQDAAFDTTNDETYGEGTGSTRGTGIGSGAATTLNNAGRWEYAIAASAVTAAGGTLQLTGGGAGGGLLYGYTSQSFAATTTQGQRTWQVIRVPQYTRASLGSTLTGLAWNGSTGGVLAIDVAGTLTLNSATVSVNGLGFRGGAGRQLTGDATAGLASTDFRTLATLTTNGSKGEGITGTPRYVYQHGATIGAPNSGNAALDTGVEGYVGGSYGRGAPGNAGGGSTDGNPAANDENSGGGGGGNGGFGGAGGNGWQCNCASGGQGGGGISPSLTRITMGGGGGAGTTNNASAETCTTLPCNVNLAANWTDTEVGTNGYYSSGANGGGVMIIRALQATGTATLTANGFAAYNVARDGGGGGGAGGSILFTTQLGDLSGLTLQAKGGSGGNSWLTTAPGGSPGQRHGPGGGGGGGYVLLSTAAASVDVSGGGNGVTTTALDNYGAQPGTSGIVEYMAGANVLPGGDGASCAVADLAVTDSATGIPVDNGGNITFTQTVVNNGPSPADSVVYTTSIPASSSFQSISVPAGWTCITPAIGGTGDITCTRPTLAQSDGTQTFSLVVQAIAGTPSGYLIANTNSVSSGTPDSNTANNTASATNPVVFTARADMSVTLANNATTTTTAGSNVTFTSVAKNIGKSTATSPTWTMAIPPNMTYQSITPPAGWTCITPAVNATSGTISCSATSLAANASVTFTPVFQVAAGTAAGTSITGTATTGAANDDDTSNNTASSSFVVRGAAGYDMVTTMSASPDPAAPADNVTFTSVVTNNGPANAPATGAGVQWVMNVPAGTNFQSMGTIPAGWVCATPAVGATSGTVTCTYQVTGVNQAFVPGTTSTFKPVFAVNASTATGTTITGSATVNINGVTTGDNVPANNTASDTTLVAASTSADIAIVKSVSPTSVGQGQLANYVLTITNNGPAVATNVAVSDPFPAGLSYYSHSVSGNVGTCAYSAGTTTLNCSFPSITVGNSFTVRVIAQATNTGTLSNTASKTAADQTDPVASNNSSTANLSVFTVTLVKMQSVDAIQQKDKVVVNWQTSFESDNLGFNVYRDVGGTKTKLNKQLIAGSAIRERNSNAANSGGTYRFRDKLPTTTTIAQYWVEDVDLKGTRTMHGPVSPGAGKVEDLPDSKALSGLGSAGAVLTSGTGIGSLHPLTLPAPTAAQTKLQLELAGDPGLKIYVSQEGWYRISRADLLATGFDMGKEDKKLSLYTDGIEQPILIGTDAIEFYGLPLDTASTGARTYWLRSGDKGSAFRITKNHDKGGDPVTASIPFTYDRRERGVYFTALVSNGDEANFFGPVVTNFGATQQLDTGAIDLTYAGNASLLIVVQGGTDGAHNVAFSLNGRNLGTTSLAGQERRNASFTFPQAWLNAGANTLTMQSMNGDEDVSVIVDTRLTYQHLLRADGGIFEADLPGARAVTVAGFSTNTVRAIDVTDVQHPVELEVTAAADPKGGYTATFTPPSGATRTVFVFDGSRVITSAELVPNAPSTWLNNNKNAVDLLIITNSTFTTAANSLAAQRQRDGLATAVVDVDDVYDEANFGMRAPEAIKTFIQSAAKNWKRAPRWVVLVGDASFDPRNYLELGAYDFVPTKLVPTAYLKTASDDWFTDFDGNNIADIPVGRIPVRTAADATTVINKIVSRGTPSGAWASRAVMVHDASSDFDFAAAATGAAKLLPNTMTVSNVGPDRSSIISALNGGALIAEFIGHGSVELWGENLFSSNDASALTNGSSLPFVVTMTCLNGYFHDLYSVSLAEAFLLNANGGAVGVWASSTLTEPDVQATMNNAFVQSAFTTGTTVGEAAQRAKATIYDDDVRKSWILFGDPSMKLK